MKRTVILIAVFLLGAVLFQSFQCSSRNITTAKVKIKNQQFDEAIESLNKELALNPNSDEALSLLADVYYQKHDKRQAAKYALKAIEVSKNPEIISTERRLINTLWVESYNTGSEFYRSYLANKNEALLDSALDNFKIGSELIPEFLEFYNMTGIVYEAKNDNKSAINSYLEYVKGFDKNYQYGLKNGLYNNMPREKMISKLGNPKLVMPDLNSKGDSVITDYFEPDGKELYIFSERTDGKMLVTGWNYNPPSQWLPSERKLRMDINTAPLGILAQHYYTEKDLEKSLKYIKMIIDLEPDNSNAYSSMVGLYQELGKTDEAVKTIQDLIKAEPKNELYVTQLADLYHNLMKYDESIKTYQQALEINPKFDRANRNLASAYKNRAVEKQKAEQDKQDKNKAYKIDMETYLPDLRQSAKYFAIALQSKTFENDMMILSELANIYQVLEEKDNLKKTVRNLEAIEFTIPQDKLEQYYLNMVRIYSEMGDNKKLEEIQKKMK